MGISIQCPNPECRKVSMLPDEFAGKSVRCRACRSKFRVTANGAGSAADTHSSRVSQVDPALHHPPAPADMPAQVGRFQIRSLLGKGAFGTVYRAHDPQLVREVALKVPHPALLDNPRILERFQREARALAGLRHPNIVPVFDVGCDQGTHYLATGFLAGQTLGDAIDEGKLTWEESAAIVQELAEALAYAHGRGIVHRDVKPDNVLLDRAGRPHLLDFGLATQQEAAEKLTHAGAIVGTPAYMPPEHAAGQPAEPRPASDQYSLGVVLYELLTGHTPFNGPANIVLHNILNQAPPLPGSLRSDIPPELETICLKAMARQPEQRYPGCQELADDLRRWREGEPIRARQLKAWQRLGRWCRRRPAHLALAAVTVVCLVLTAVLASFSAVSLARSKAGVEALRQQAQEQAERAGSAAATAREQAAQAEADAEQTRQAEKRTEKANGEVLRATEQAAEKTHEATLALKEAEAKEKAGREELYQAHLRLARYWAERKDFVQARQWLVRQRPLSEQVDLREAKWFQLADEIAYPPGSLSQPSRVNAVAFSPDRMLLASAESNGTIQLLDVGTVRWSLTEHRADVWSIAFSPDGKMLASASADRTVLLRDVSTGKKITTLLGHTDTVYAVAFHPGGMMLVSGSADKSIKLWNVASGKNEATLQGHTDSVNAMAFNPEGTLLASASSDKSVRLWDPSTGKEIRTLGSHTDRVYSLAFSPDGKTLASGGWDHTIKLWEVASGQNTSTFSGHTGSVHSVAFSPDGQILASCSDDKTVRLWDVALGREAAVFLGHSGPVSSVAFRPDRKTLVSGSSDKTICLWEIPAGELVASRAVKDGKLTKIGYNGMSAYPHEAAMLVFQEGDTVKLWNVRAGSSPVPVPGNLFPDATHPLACTPDGKTLAVTDNNGVIKIWDLPTGKNTATWTLEGGSFQSLALSPDGKTVAATAKDIPKIQLWQGSHYQRNPLTNGYKATIHALAFSPDSKKLASVASGGRDRALLWDVASEKVIASLGFQGSAEGIGGVSFSPDGKTLLLNSVNQTLGLWNVEARAHIATLPKRNDLFFVPTFSPDGKTLAVVYNGDEVQLWDVASGKKRATLFSKTLDALAFTPDSKMLVTGERSGNISLWDGASTTDTITSVHVGNEDKKSVRYLALTITVRGHNGLVNYLACSADGKLVVSYGHDKILKVWHLPPR